MATTTSLGGATVGPDALADWVPGPPARLSLERYETLVASGAITKRDKVQLINGYLVSTMTHNPPHSIADDLCGAALSRVFGEGWYVRGAKPVRLPEQSSMPEPDRSVARGTIRDWGQRHPEPRDLALIVEVADSSLAEDRKLALLYGRAGVPAYWIINLVDRQVEVYSRPGPRGYQSLEVLAEGHVLVVEVDGRVLGEIAVNELLP